MNRRRFLKLSAAALLASTVKAPTQADVVIPPGASYVTPWLPMGIPVLRDCYIPAGEMWAFGGTGFSAEEGAGLSDDQQFALLVSRGARVAVATDVWDRLVAAS